MATSENVQRYLSSNYAITKRGRHVFVHSCTIKRFSFFSAFFSSAFSPICSQSRSQLFQTTLEENLNCQNNYFANHNDNQVRIRVSFVFADAYQRLIRERHLRIRDSSEKRHCGTRRVNSLLSYSNKKHTKKG